MKVPREIFRFFRYFKLWKSTRRESKGCKVQGVIAERFPITMMVKKHKISPVVFNKMKQLILENYTGPGDMKKNRRSKVRWRSGVNDNLEEFNSAYDVEANQ